MFLEAPEHQTPGVHAFVISCISRSTCRNSAVAGTARIHEFHGKTWEHQHTWDISRICIYIYIWDIIPDNDVSIIRRYVIYWVFSVKKCHGDLISSVARLLAGYCWWFCWKHHFYWWWWTHSCRYLQIFADESWVQAKKNNKKTTKNIAHSFFWWSNLDCSWSNPNFSLLNSKVVDKPNLIRQCVSGSNVSMVTSDQEVSTSFNLVRPRPLDIRS